MRFMLFRCGVGFFIVIFMVFSHHLIVGVVDGDTRLNVNFVVQRWGEVRKVCKRVGRIMIWFCSDILTKTGLRPQVNS